MERYFGSEEEEIRQYIISDSPFLRVFVDACSRSDFEMWLKAVDDTFVTENKDLFEKINEKIVKKDARALYHYADQNKIINNKYSDEIKIGLITYLSCMGLEIGSEESLYLFIDDVTGQLVLLGAIKDNSESRKFIRNAMRTGVRWKENIRKETPDEFANFIAGLDF